ncbi:condensation domain-containing protein [Nocardia altamirensis]|uniref:condensation domain-containing protein n=1 Tax=Nocardia altamirensis TaxID=472158 RepID=UPI00083FECBF|nr:condensation domain-containing protein [Nocardia altamirensis]
MEFIELADYPLPSGRVIEWLPTATSHWADWPRDTRAVSYNHEHHLRDAVEHSRIRDHRHYWLGHVFQIDEPLDPQAWRTALDTWIDRHEGLRTHVTIEGGRPARYTLPPGEIRVQPSDAGAPTSTMATYRLVQGLLDDGTSPLRWPSYVCVTIANRDGFTVVFGADHSIMDGYSTVSTGGELHALYIAARTGETARLLETGSYVDFSQDERTRAISTTAADPAVDTWRMFFPEHTENTLPCGTLSKVAAAPIETTDPAEAAPRRVSQRNLSVEVLDADAADAAAAVAREQGQGLFAALLAAFAVTTTELGAGRDFRTVIPLHTRTDPQWAETLGWFVGLAPFQLDCGVARNLSELITPAGQELRRTRSAATVPFARVCELLGTWPRISFMVSYMDIRSAPSASTWLDTDTRWLRSRNVSPTEFFFWFVRTPMGVTLNMRYPGTTKATRDIHRHVLRMRDLLAEFTRYGDARIRPIEGAPLSW